MRCTAVDTAVDTCGSVRHLLADMGWWDWHKSAAQTEEAGDEATDDENERKVDGDDVDPDQDEVDDVKIRKNAEPWPVPESEDSMGLMHVWSATCPVKDCKWKNFKNAGCWSVTSENRCRSYTARHLHASTMKGHSLSEQDAIDAAIAASIECKELTYEEREQQRNWRKQKEAAKRKKAEEAKAWLDAKRRRADAPSASSGGKPIARGTAVKANSGGGGGTGSKGVATTGAVAKAGSGGGGGYQVAHVQGDDGGTIIAWAEHQRRMQVSFFPAVDFQAMLAGTFAQRVRT